MHRSRLALPVIITAMAACSTHTSNSAEAARVLSQDTSLAHLDLRQKTTLVSLPDQCGSVAAAPAPSNDGQRQAGELTRQAYDAELTGDVQQAQSLLQRASQLDGTNKSIAYHLARTSESVGDRATATSAYCRYLTLNPTTAESMDARQRVAKLAQAPAQVASVASSSTNVMRRRAVAPATRRRVSSHSRWTPRVVVADASGPAGRAPMPVEHVPSASTSGGEVDESRTSSAPIPPPRTTRRGPSRVQGAGIGAGIGAIMGAAAGRSVKSAILGAAAGGVLGSVVGGGSQ